MPFWLELHAQKGGGRPRVEREGVFLGCIETASPLEAPTGRSGRVEQANRRIEPA